MEDLIAAKLHRLDDLAEDDRDQLSGLLGGRRCALAGEALVEEGGRPTFSMLLLSGFVGRASTLADGGRQITAINVPGDFIDLHGFLLKTMDHSLAALSDVIWKMPPGASPLWDNRSNRLVRVAAMRTCAGA